MCLVNTAEDSTILLLFLKDWLRTVLYLFIYLFDNSSMYFYYLNVDRIV